MYCTKTSYDIFYCLQIALYCNKTTINFTLALPISYSKDKVQTIWSVFNLSFIQKKNQALNIPSFKIKQCFQKQRKVIYFRGSKWVLMMLNSNFKSLNLVKKIGSLTLWFRFYGFSKLLTKTRKSCKSSITEITNISIVWIGIRLKIFLIAEF